MASILLGVLNAVWHAPLYWLLANPVYDPFSPSFLGFLLFEIGYTLVVTVVWLKTKRSVFVGTFVHSSVTIATLYLPTWERLSTLLLSGGILFATGLWLYAWSRRRE